eukprot:scaffold3224_cov172-Pinguiococcus_pyrenoidosus.AAC.4
MDPKNLIRRSAVSGCRVSDAKCHGVRKGRACEGLGKKRAALAWEQPTSCPRCQGAMVNVKHTSGPICSSLEERYH